MAKGSKAMMDDVYVSTPWKGTGEDEHPKQQIENDAHSLVRAASVKGDKGRHKKARARVQEMRDEHAKRTSAIDQALDPSSNEGPDNNLSKAGIGVG